MKRSHFIYLAITLAAFAAFVLVSCSNHLSPVKEYLEEYTSGAGIGTHAIVTEWRKDSAQTANLPSASAARIRFLMRNPRSYTIDYDIVFDDALVNSGASSPTDYEFVTASDRQSFELVLHPGFLRRNEGRNISATVSLSENLTGRPFEPYHFALVSNTAPPVPQGPLVMISTGGSNVVCFNLDLSDAIHGDIDAVLINGVAYPVVSVGAGSPQSLSFDASSAATTVEPSGMLPHAGTTAFVAAAGMTAVYVVTGDSAATPKNYLVSVRDERGLLSSATVSSNPNQLGQVLVTDGNGQLVANLPNATLVIPSSGTTSSVVLTGPTGSTLYWSYTKDVTTLESGTSTTIPHTIPLSPGNYSLTAYARMAGYSDSDPITVNFKVITTINEVYVHPYNGSDASVTGTYGEPVQTIGRAVQMLTNQNDPTNTIHLLEDVPGLAPASYPEDMVRLELDHDTQFTLEGNNNTIGGGNSKRCLYISSGSNVVKVTIHSLNINNGIAKTALPYGGGIYFNAPTGDSSLTLDDCDIWNNSVVNTSQPDAGGGGVYARCGTVSLINGSTIRENDISSTSIARGAGLCVEGSGTVEINDSSFSYNEITNSTTTEGAGLYCAGASVSAPITCNISNSQMTNNSGVASGMGYGGGIYAENATVTLSASSNLQDNTANKQNGGRGGGLYAYNADVTISLCTIQNNKATYSPSSFSVEGVGGGICFVKNQGNSSLTLIDTDVTGNSCNIGSTVNGKTAGAGIYVIGTGSTPTIVSLSGKKINNNVTNPAANSFSSSEGGLGGGLCLIGRVQATIDRIWINNNVANNCTSGTGTGKGGGIYFDSQSFSDASLTIINAAIIGGNTASNGAGGEGGGIYLKSGSNGKIDFTLQDGSILGNYASTSSGTGKGGGIYATSANPASASKLSVSISGGSVSGNIANSSTGAGYGGGIYSDGNTALTVSGGYIGDNLGSATGTSEGDGIQLVGSAGNTTQFSLSAPSIGTTNAASVTKQAINITNQYVETTFTNGAKVDSSAVVVLNSNATISTSAYLTEDTVANIRLAVASQLDVLTGDTRLNYYKFLMETPGLCVNANGRKSKVNLNSVSLYGDIINALSLLPYTDTDETMLISVTIPNGTVSANPGNKIVIPSNSNVRIVPSVPMTLSVSELGTIIQVADGGHLLFGSPTDTALLRYQSASTPLRTGNTIDTGTNSSLVLRNVQIQDAATDPFTPAEAALVSSGSSGTIVLEKIKYSENMSMLNSMKSAIMLKANSLCHFVSGEIIGFTNSGTYGGFADLETGASLIIHDGTFTGNTTVNGRSVTGGGLIFNPKAIDLK